MLTGAKKHLDDLGKEATLTDILLQPLLFSSFTTTTADGTPTYMPISDYARLSKVRRRMSRHRTLQPVIAASMEAAGDGGHAFR